MERVRWRFLRYGYTYLFYDFFTMINEPYVVTVKNIWEKTPGHAIVYGENQQFEVYDKLSETPPPDPIFIIFRLPLSGPPYPTLAELAESYPTIFRNMRLHIPLAKHIGVLALNADKEFPNGDPLEMLPFVDGEEYVRLEKCNLYIFREFSLHTWFQTSKKNPLTGIDIGQKDIERFTYVSL